MMFRWICYILADPDGHDVFYVGITRRTWEMRLSGHKSDPASAAYDRIRQIRERGQEPICVVLKYFSTEETARVFERSMIVMIDNELLNREARWPIGEMLYRRDDRYDQPWGAHDAGSHVEPIDDGWEVPQLRRKGAGDA